MQEATWILAGRSDFGSALRILSEVPQAHLDQSLIEAYWKQDQQQPEAALERFRRVESRNPLNPGLLQWISYCLYTQGRKEEALRVLKKVADLRPEDAGVQRRIGEIELEGRRQAAFRHLEAKNWEAARAAFSELAGGSEPGDRRASYQLHLAYCHQQLGQLRQAARTYANGLRSHPGAHWARLNLASTLYRLSRFREAVEQWERLPGPAKTAPIYFQLGVCYLHLDRYDRAEAAFRQSLEKGNRSPQLLYNLGTTLLRQFKTAEAWALIRRSAAANYPPALALLRRAGLTGR